MCVHACAGQHVHPCVQKLGDKLGATYFSFFPFFFTPSPPNPVLIFVLFCFEARSHRPVTQQTCWAGW